MVNGVLCSEIPHCARTRAPRDPIPRGTAESAEGQSAAYVTILILQLKPYNKKQLSQTILCPKPHQTQTTVLTCGHRCRTPFVRSFFIYLFPVRSYFLPTHPISVFLPFCLYIFHPYVFSCEHFIGCLFFTLSLFLDFYYGTLVVSHYFQLVLSALRVEFPFFLCLSSSL
jgi:hypothetical protein